MNLIETLRQSIKERFPDVYTELWHPHDTYDGSWILDAFKDKADLSKIITIEWNDGDNDEPQSFKLCHHPIPYGTWWEPLGEDMRPINSYETYENEKDTLDRAITLIEEEYK